LVQLDVGLKLIFIKEIVKIFFFYTQICGIFPQKSLTKVVTKILMLRFLWQKSVPRHTVWSSVSKATAFFFYIFAIFAAERTNGLSKRWKLREKAG